MGRLEISQWGHNINNELKYTYEKAYEEKPVKKSNWELVQEKRKKK